MAPEFQRHDGQRRGVFRQRVNWGGEFEAFEVDELAKLEMVTKVEICVALVERDVGRVERVGNLNIEALVGPHIGAGQGWDYLRSLCTRQRFISAIFISALVMREGSSRSSDTECATLGNCVLKIQG